MWQAIALRNTKNPSLATILAVILDFGCLVTLIRSPSLDVELPISAFVIPRTVKLHNTLSLSVFLTTDNILNAETIN